ncbi:MAG TPA: NEW3 domain-containing protein, partial [Nitriliruptorales bacterium]|nr:NEW3 domain-containing protein [Nitriliruptorales bacterium]
GSARRAAAVACAVMALLPLGTPSASAQAVQLVTSYPSVDVEAGGSVSLDLEVRSSTPQRVDLEVVQAPEGWTATLRGGGFVVHSVFTDPESPPDLSLEVVVPADAAQGTHALVVAARAQDGTADQLRLDLRVAEQVAGAVSFQTDFPRLSGGGEDTFSYELTLDNDVPQEITFALSTQAPEGWQVEATPSQQARATTVTVEGGGSATINVEATPPADAAAGDYPIAVEATGGGQSASIELVAEVVGSVQLSLTTPSQRLNASGSAGEATRVTLLVVNEGSAPLANVSLSASPPSGWEVTFDPEAVASVPPGESVEVAASITPGGDAVAGDYIVTMTASGEGRSSGSDIRFTVQTSPLWGLFGLTLILAAVAGLVFVFRRYGRR